MNYRNFTSKSEKTGAHVPPAAMTVSGFQKGEEAEGRALSDVVVLLKKRMCASELLRAAGALSTLAIELYTSLRLACGGCEHCSETCPYGLADFAAELEVDEAFRERAGIPEDAKLRVDCGDGLIVIREDDDSPSLRDVPPHIMAAFLTAGGCPKDLEAHLAEGDIVYGGE